MPCSATLKRVEVLPDEAKANDPLDAILGDAGRDDTAAQRIIETVDRADLVEAQTPQVFTLELIRRAYARIKPGDNQFTDDAGLVEALGEPVLVVEGESTNLKITRPADMELAMALTIQRDAASAKDVAGKRLFAEEEE
jgi:2-C-methyl-D-erythritol 4-phosphate cytidylyltransferase